MTFASPSWGRWVRFGAGFFGVCLVLGVGVVQARESMAAAGDHAAMAGQVVADGLSTTMLGVLGALKPAPHAALIASGALLTCLLLREGWRWFCRNRLFVMKPYEVALQRLESTQYRSEQGKVADPRRAILDILQDYVETQFEWRLPELGRDLAFRSFAREGALLTDNQRILLREVLEAPADASTQNHQECFELGEKAARFIWATASSGVPKGMLASLAGWAEASRRSSVVR